MNPDVVRAKRLKTIQENKKRLSVSLPGIFECLPAPDIKSVPLENIGLTAGTFDFIGIHDVIEECIGKSGSHVVVSNGVLCKALVLQMLDVNYQSLYGTSEYYARMPLDTLLGVDISPQDLNRHVLGRFLDDVNDYGAEKLFIKCASKACLALGIDITEVHIDSTSFHYDGQSREDDRCELILKPGYSRDHRPDLNQVNVIAATDATSKIPVFSAAVSGNITDKTAFLDVLANKWPLLQEEFSNLTYLVADSAICTEDNLSQARKNNVYIVTRVPDNFNISKELLASHSEQELSPINPDDPNCTVRAQICGVQKLCNNDVQLMVVYNTKMRRQKTDTINRRASKELEKVKASLKKLATNPCKCQSDAQMALDKILKGLKLCAVYDVKYEEIEKNATRGRPKKGDVPLKKVVAVKVIADVKIDEDKVAAAIENELKFVIATTDVSREWTCEELFSIYMRQSTIERVWRAAKDPTMFVDAIYLKSPHRINALMWLMSIALLVYAVTEYKTREIMKENKLKIPAPDNKTAIENPTFERLNKYIKNCKICLSYNSATDEISISGMTMALAKILDALGDCWTKYYIPMYYKFGNHIRSSKNCVYIEDKKIS